MTKKIFTLLTALMLSIGIGWAEMESYSMLTQMDILGYETMMMTEQFKGTDTGKSMLASKVNVPYAAPRRATMASYSATYDWETDILDCACLSTGTTTKWMFYDLAVNGNSYPELQIYFVVPNDDSKSPVIDGIRYPAAMKYTIQNSTNVGTIFNSNVTKNDGNKYFRTQYFVNSTTAGQFYSGAMTAVEGKGGKPYITTTTTIKTSGGGTSFDITIGSPKPNYQAGTISVAVKSGQSAMGTVSGGGYGQGGAEIQISATANEGYVFKQWNDGKTDNPRTVVVDGNATYTAEFIEAVTIEDKNAVYTQGNGYFYVEGSTTGYSAHFESTQAFYTGNFTAIDKDYSWVQPAGGSKIYFSNATCKISQVAGVTYCLNALFSNATGPAYNMIFYFTAPLSNDNNDCDFTPEKTLNVAEVGYTFGCAEVYASAVWEEWNGQKSWDDIDLLFVGAGRCSDGDIIPAGVYPIDFSGNPGTVLAGKSDSQYDYTVVTQQRQGIGFTPYKLVSGTVTVTKSGNTTTFVVNAKNSYGKNVNATFSGNLSKDYNFSNYNYSATTDGNGTIQTTKKDCDGNFVSVGNSGSAIEGAQLKFEATGNSGYEFDYWTLNGEGHYEMNPVTLNGLVTNANLKAYFKQGAVVHDITFKVEGQKDVVIQVAEGDVPEYTGDAPTKASTVSTVYTFSGWNDGITTYTGALPKVGSSDVTYTAQFSESTRQYTVTITAPTNGSIKVMNGNTEVKTGDKVDYNTVLTVTATAADHYHFAAWTNDGAASVTVTGDKTIGATFAIDTYTLTMDACENGTYSVTYGGQTKYTGAAEQTFTIDYNTSVTLSAEPATGYEFKGWRQIVDNSGNVDAAPRRAAMDNGATIADGPEEEETLIKDETLPFNIQADAEYQAVFQKQRFTLTVNIEGDGTVEARKAGILIEPVITVDYNTEITLTAIPNTAEHNIFDSWSDGVIDAERVIKVTKDSTITVTFKKETFTLTTVVNNAAWGTIEVTPEQETYEWGTIVTIKAVNTLGYQFNNWNGDDELKDKSLELEMTEDMTFTANFKENFKLVDDKNLGDDYYNTLAALAESGETMNVTYVRTISAGWNVVSLPFNYSYRKGTNTALRGNLRSIDKVVYSDGVLTINFLPVTTSIVANAPYVLFSTEEIVNPVFEGVTFEPQEQVVLNKALTAEGVAPVEGSIDFLNTTYRQKIGWVADGSARLPENERKKIIYMNNNSLHFPGATNTVTMRAFRAYFHLNIDDADIQHAPIRFVLEDENEILELQGEDAASTVETKKYFDNEGNLIIERNGVKFDAQGKQL